MFGTKRTERPVEPPNILQPFEQFEDEEAFIMEMKREGKLGIFYDRHRTTSTPTLIDINFPNLRTSVYLTVTRVLNQLNPQTPELTITGTANAIANAVLVMTYNKLRILNYLDTRVHDRCGRKPKVPIPFEVPQPYALAISQLGKIKISGMPDQIYLSPTAPPEADVTFGCPRHQPWCPNVYTKAVEFAKKLGMRFATVDLGVKMGSSWWLYRPVVEDNVFRLHCPYPEENFTVESAVLASLFCNNPEGGFMNPIVNIASLGTVDFGTMMRDPPLDISLDTYNAVIETSDVNQF